MNHEHSPLLFCFYTMHSQTFLKIAKKVLFKGKHLKTKMIPESVSLGINAVIIVLSRDDESGCKLVSMLSFVPGKHNRPVYILIVIHSIFSDSVDCGCTCLSLSGDRSQSTSTFTLSAELETLYYPHLELALGQEVQANFFWPRGRILQ